MPAVQAETTASKPEKRTLRVLVTGFGPFRNVENNPSWLAVSKLNNQTLTFSPAPQPSHPHAPKPHPVQVEAHITAIEVPVTYSAVLSTIPPLHATKQYDVVLHVGVGLPGGLKIERQAHKTGYNQPDAEGRMCDRIAAAPANAEEQAVIGEQRGKRGFGQGYEHFGEQLKTGVDVDGVVELLRSKGLEHTEPSNDPGRYLCDFIYFCSLACAQNDGGRAKVLFMHVPPAGSPYQIEDMTRAVKGIIEYFATHM